MELILFRHGIAEEREDWAKKNPDDHLRPLTLKGRRRVQKVGMRLRDWIGEIDMIVSSPYTRARQTAEILAQVYYETPVEEAAELVPQSPVASFVKWLRSHARDCSRVVMVGHEPHMTTFASYLLAGSQDSFLSLKKGGVMCLEVESFDKLQAGDAELMWSVPPRMIID